METKITLTHDIRTSFTLLYIPNERINNFSQKHPCTSPRRAISRLWMRVQVWPLAHRQPQNASDAMQQKFTCVWQQRAAHLRGRFHISFTHTCLACQWKCQAHSPHTSTQKRASIRSVLVCVSRMGTRKPPPPDPSGDRVHPLETRSGTGRDYSDDKRRCLTETRRASAHRISEWGKTRARSVTSAGDDADDAAGADAARAGRDHWMRLETWVWFAWMRLGLHFIWNEWV